MTAIVFCDVQHFLMSWSDKKVSKKKNLKKKHLLVWPAQICFTPHCTIWFFSDAQLPDTLRVVYTNLARASQFWTFWYRILDGPSGGRDISGGSQTPERTTRQTASVDQERTTPYNLPTTVDRNRGKTTNNTPSLNFRNICTGDWELISPFKSKPVELCGWLRVIWRGVRSDRDFWVTKPVATKILKFKIIAGRYHKTRHYAGLLRDSFKLVQKTNFNWPIMTSETWYEDMKTALKHPTLQTVWLIYCNLSFRLIFQRGDNLCDNNKTLSNSGFSNFQI